MFIRFHLANDDSGVVGKSYDLGWRPCDTNQPGKLVKSCYLINLSLLPSKLRGKGSNWISEWDAAGNPNYSSGSCASGRIVVGLRKRACPRSRGASRHGHELPNLQTQIMSGAHFFGFRDPVFRGEEFKTVLATHSAGLTCAISLPPAKKKKKSLGTCTPCSQSSPANPTRPNNKDRCLRGDHLPVQDFRRRHDL